MKHVPKQPREGINVSDTHPLVEASTLVVGLAALFGAIVIAIVFLIEIALYFVSAEKEAAFFRDWLPAGLVKVAPDDERLRQTQVLVDRLALHWAESPYDFRVEIDESSEANAMAFPGGLIVITTGLLDQVESENELAFVLGHELGHYRNRDHLRALGRGILLSVLFAVVMGSDVGNLGITVTDLALRGFSRNQESKADAFGLAVVHTHYGHVNQAWRLFERWDVGDDSLLDVVSYLSTHPLSDDRIDDLEELAVRERWPMDGAVTPLSW